MDGPREPGSKEEKERERGPSLFPPIPYCARPTLYHYAGSSPLSTFTLLSLSRDLSFFSTGPLFQEMVAKRRTCSNLAENGLIELSPPFSSCRMSNL